MGNTMEPKYQWEHENHQQQVFEQVMDLVSHVGEISAFVQNSYVRMLGAGIVTPSEIANKIPKASESFDNLISDLQRLKVDVIGIMKHHSLTTVEPDTTVAQQARSESGAG